MPTTTIL